MKTQYFVFISFLFISFFISCTKNSHVESESSKTQKYFVSENKVLSLLTNKSLKIEKSATTSPLREKSIQEVFPVEDEEKNIVYYIINYNNGGFIIVSADERISPILAYSETSDFNTKSEYYPSGLVSWLSETKEFIKHIRNSDIKQSNEVKLEWDNFDISSINGTGMIQPLAEGEGPEPECNDTFIQLGPYLTTSWGQRCGFNNNMPTISCTNTICNTNNNAFAGCVPVSIAQVMFYHRFPNSYNWNAMNTITGGAETSALIRDIYDFIPSSKKSFDCSGTGVYNSYNSALVFSIGNNYTSAIQANFDESKIRIDLAQARPVILSGGRYSGWWIFKTYNDGHMWVCDGYQESLIW